MSKILYRIKNRSSGRPPKRADAANVHDDSVMTDLSGIKRLQERSLRVLRQVAHGRHAPDFFGELGNSAPSITQIYEHR